MLNLQCFTRAGGMLLDILIFLILSEVARRIPLSILLRGFALHFAIGLESKHFIPAISF